MTDYLVITRSKSIKATPDAIAPHIADFHNWVDWSPWEGLDPELKRTYSGSDNGVGASYTWDGNRKAGAGNMEITSVKPDAIAIDLTFSRPFKSASKTDFEFKADGDSTVVTWTVRNPKSFMMRVMGIFMNFDKTVGTDLDKGLAQLDTVVTRG